MLDDDASERWFDGISAAIEAIDEHKKKVFNAKREKLSLAALFANSGAACTITGIHASHGNLLTTPSVEKYRIGNVIIGNVIPDVPWLRELAARAKALSKELESISSTLHRYRIATSWDVGNAEKYIASIRSLKESYELSRNKALENAPKADVAKP